MQRVGAVAWLAGDVTAQRRRTDSGADDRLRELLGTDPPAAVDALDPAVRDRLADIIATARARQSSALLEAFDATLKHVPFPARKLVKKVLLG